jgi:hypothetical protein
MPVNISLVSMKIRFRLLWKGFTRTYTSVPPDIRFVVSCAAVAAGIGLPFLFWRYDYGWWGTARLLFVYGAAYATAAFLLFGAYIAIRTVGLLGSGTSIAATLITIREYVISSMRTLFILYCASACMIFFGITFFSSVSFERFSQTTLAVAALETVENMPFAFSIGASSVFADVPVIETIIRGGYLQTVGWLVVTWFVLGVIAQRSARKLLVAQVAAFVIAIPIWMAVPTGSPQMLYQQSILGAAHTIEPEILLHGVSESTAHVLEILAETWRFNPNMYIPASALPSMHSVWAILLWWYSRRVGLWWSGPMTIIALGSLIGTVYYLQHFFIDIAAGMVLAAVAIALASRIVGESSDGGWYQLFDDIRTDIEKLWKRVRLDVQNRFVRTESKTL